MWENFEGLYVKRIKEKIKLNRGCGWIRITLKLKLFLRRLKLQLTTKEKIMMYFKKKTPKFCQKVA